MTLSYEELVELNKDALEWLKQERPIVYRTLLRWFRGEEHWNRWAEKLLHCRKELNDYNINFSLIKLLSHQDDENKYISNNKDDSIKVIIADSLDFSGMKFPGHVNFCHTVFHGEVDFHEAKFFGNVDFSHATFDSGANFLGVKFSSKIHQADFHGVTFSSYAGFSGAIFSGGADFHDAIFSGESCFQDAVFSSDANFQKVTFSGDTDFQVRIFSRDANFRLAIFEKSVDLSGVKFNKCADFSAIRIEKIFNLRGVRFHITPNFIDATFKILPVLDHIKIDNQLRSKHRVLCFQFNSLPDVSMELSRDISRRFRILGRRAHETRDWLHEMEFFAQEIRTRRFGLDKPFGRNMGRFWFGWFYEVLSNFGRSFARPLGWWSGLTVAFTLLYMALAVHGKEAIWSWLDPFYLSVRHGLVVGGLVRTGHMQDVIERMFCKLGSGLALLMMLQTVLSAFFLFLFFLAVRNHFRIR